MIDIIARAMAAKALQNGGGTPGGDDTFEATGVTTYEVGGIPAGTDLNGKTWQQIFTMMLYGDASVPVLTDPSFTVNMNESFGQVGETQTVTGTAIFNRGSINPAYGTSGFRAGLPTSYVVNGTTYETSVTEYGFSLDLPIVSGENKFTVTVNYAQGEQPLDGAGNNYDSPYPAGSLSYEVVVTGTYPVYIKDSNGDLIPMDIQTQFNENGELEVDLASEFDAPKQTIAFVEGTPEIVGVQQYDPSRQVWDWLYGSPADSLTAFTVTQQTIDVNGTVINYSVWENNTVTVGPRKLKFFTQLPADQGDTN